MFTGHLKNRRGGKREDDGEERKFREYFSPKERVSGGLKFASEDLTHSPRPGRIYLHQVQVSYESVRNRLSTRELDQGLYKCPPCLSVANNKN